MSRSRAFGILFLGLVGGIALRATLEWLNLTPVPPYMCFEWQPLGLAGLAAFIAAIVVIPNTELRKKPTVLWYVALAGFVATSTALTFTATLPCSPM